MTHICVSRLIITGSDNGLSPGRHQAIIWPNAGILLIGPLGTNFIENSMEILTFSFTKMRLKVSSVKWRPFCLGLNVLRPVTNVVRQRSISNVALVCFLCFYELFVPPNFTILLGTRENGLHCRQKKIPWRLFINVSENQGIKQKWIVIPKETNGS